MLKNLIKVLESQGFKIKTKNKLLCTKCALKLYFLHVANELTIRITLVRSS